VSDRQDTVLAYADNFQVVDFTGKQPALLVEVDVVRRPPLNEHMVPAIVTTDVEARLVQELCKNAAAVVEDLNA
jgi:hypothetical protein